MEEPGPVCFLLGGEQDRSQLGAKWGSYRCPGNVVTHLHCLDVWADLSQSTSEPSTAWLCTGVKEQATQQAALKLGCLLMPDPLWFPLHCLCCIEERAGRDVGTTELWNHALCWNAEKTMWCSECPWGLQLFVCLFSKNDNNVPAKYSCRGLRIFGSWGVTRNPMEEPQPSWVYLSSPPREPDWGLHLALVQMDFMEMLQIGKKSTPCSQN